ncbi:hypothetical protein QWY99_07260 [Flavobacterium branchiarum]|uniref:Uncharacterized protein n=1 Tax=Flavobacterium branchiarum TaxID=1114870 RepID=A0ABV5FRG9_9FLAO|nr:hypothetical protein [Flavobacterium branchiarum]MDN3672847.1 hypothetical protein [Flavobacterium branchiarum]
MKVKTKAILFFGGMFSLLLFAYIRGYCTDNKLKENGKKTIARLDSIVTPPKWASTVYLTYYIDNKKYTSFESDIEYKTTKNDIGKFYEMKYLPESPEIVRGNYSKEITDTLAILNAGFSREDIENSNLGKE